MMTVDEDEDIIEQNGQRFMKYGDTYIPILDLDDVKPTEH